MVEADFVDITTEMEKFYEKEYNDEQRKYIFETFKNLPKERYRQVVNIVFRTCKFLPKLADLIEIEQNLPKEKKEEKEKVDCKLCNGTGFINYTKLIPNGDKKLEYQFVARCGCANSDGISELIPLAAEIGI